MFIWRGIVWTIQLAFRCIGYLIAGIFALAFIGTVVAMADYLATQGSGTTFASLVISAKHYAAMVLCDATSGESQCVTVLPPSTQATATNTSLPVQLTPNSPGVLPAGQSTMSNSLPVAIASDQSAVSFKLNATPSLANGNGIVPTQGGSALGTTNGTYSNLLQGNAVLSVTNGLYSNLLQSNAALSYTNPLPIATSDPCTNGTKIPVSISQTTSTQLIALSSNKKNYICSYLWNGSDAESISLVEGTGTVCASSTVALVGGTTASTGNNFAANSGAAQGNGAASVAQGTTAAGANVCLLQSGTGRVAGVLMIVQQ